MATEKKIIPKWKKTYNAALRKYSKDVEKWNNAQSCIKHNMARIKKAGSADSICNSIMHFIEYTDSSSYDIKLSCSCRVRPEGLEEISFPKTMLKAFLDYCRQGIEAELMTVTKDLGDLYLIQEPVRPKEKDYVAEDSDR